MAAVAQLVQSIAHDPFQSTLATGQHDYRNLPVVASAAIAADIALRYEAIDQIHGAAMPDKKAFRNTADAGFMFPGKCTKGKNHLILLRFEAGDVRTHPRAHPPDRSQGVWQAAAPLLLAQALRLS